MTDVSITIRTIDQTTKGTKSSMSNLKALKTTVLAVGASLTALGITARKVFDWGEQGAAITQTRESFELFLEKVDAAPGLLDALREASRGTIKDTNLMSATMTLAAGAEDELAQSLINATPRLMEIAKAANKLNPALGDTNFMFQSIATGVKRASKLILDNLGIDIKLSEAYDNYANILGKSSDELTLVEQKMAILNETMRVGGTLVEQAGGTTESATDAYAQLKVIIGETWDEIKVGISEVILPLIKELRDVVYESREFKDILDELGISARFIGGIEKGIVYVDQFGRVIATSKEEVLEYAEAQRQANAPVQEYMEMMRGYRYAASDYVPLTEEMTEATRELTDEMKELAEAAIKELDYLIGVDLDETLQDHEEKVKDLEQDYRDAQDALNDFIAEYGGLQNVPAIKMEEFQDLKAAIDDSAEAIEKEKLAWQRNTQEIIFNMAARALEALPVDVQAEALAALAEQMGLIDEPTATAWENIGNLTGLLADDKITVDEFATAIDTLGMNLTDLPEEVSPEVALEITGLNDLERAYFLLRQMGVDLPLTIPHQPERRQFGGSVERGKPYWVGESGRPELFVPPQSGTIMPMSPYGLSSSTFSVGEIHVHVGDGADGSAIVDEMMTEINRRVEMGIISGAGYVGI